MLMPLLLWLAASLFSLCFSANVQVMPTLRHGPHVYYAEFKFTSPPANVSFEPSPDGTFDGVNLADVQSECQKQCPQSYQIRIAMFNRMNGEFPGWYTWEGSPVLLDEVQLAEENSPAVLNIEFGNHFSLNISPKLADGSNVLYRVNVYCADNGKLEFISYTQSETIVVFKSNFKVYTDLETESRGTKSVGKKCSKYDVKVWPLYSHWLYEANSPQQISTQIRTNSLFGPEFFARSIQVENGKTHGIEFPEFFNLSIDPPLDPNGGPIYFAKVKCSANEEALAFVTLTHGHTQIVLNEERCDSYDISVSQLDRAIVDPKETFAIDAQSEERAVPIANGTTHTHKFMRKSDGMGGDDAQQMVLE